MAQHARDAMIGGAVQLLATSGLQGTSFAEVLALTGAPRGSIYHHFPGGKDELIAAALEVVRARAVDALEPSRGSSVATVTERFLELWSQLLDHADLRAGCAAVAVTVAADSPDLLGRAGDVFRGWTTHLSGLFVDAGLSPKKARRFAIVLISATEGAVVLSRAEQSREPFDVVSRDLRRQARDLSTPPAPPR